MDSEKLCETLGKWLDKGFNKGYLDEFPEWLGFIKDYIHTPEQFVWPRDQEVLYHSSREKPTQDPLERYYIDKDLR